MILLYNEKTMKYIPREVYFMSLIGYKTKMTDTGIPAELEAESKEKDYYCIHFEKDESFDKDLCNKSKRLRKKIGKTEKKIVKNTLKLYKYIKKLPEITILYDISKCEKHIKSAEDERLLQFEKYFRLKGEKMPILIPYEYQEDDTDYHFINFIPKDGKIHISYDVQEIVSQISKEFSKGYTKIVAFDMKKVIRKYRVPSEIIGVYVNRFDETDMRFECSEEYDAELPAFECHIVLENEKNDENAQKYKIIFNKNFPDNIIKYNFCPMDFCIDIAKGAEVKTYAPGYNEIFYVNY